MKKLLLWLLLFPILGIAQTDSFQMPLVMHITPIFTKRSVGYREVVAFVQEHK